MNKDFDSVVAALKEQGFVGFKTVRELKNDCSMIDEVMGIYVVLRASEKEPEFLTVGTGGHFKDREPNVTVEELKSNWLPGCPILYIGNAKKDRLRKRITEYMRFGSGEKKGHWGGRYIWQLADADDLIVCWKETANDSRAEEKEMIASFKQAHNDQRPFANLQD